MDRRWADSTRFLGGESKCGSVNRFGPGKFRSVGAGITCGRGEEGSAWNRDLRDSDWRRERVGGCFCDCGCGDGGVGVSGLRMLENHLWSAAAEDNSLEKLSGGSLLVKDSDLLRVCLADFDMISPLKLSTALYLFEKKKKKCQLDNGI